VFEWSYDLHNYASYERAKRCGGRAVLIPSIDAVKPYYAPEKFPNNEWGRVFWTLLHYVAANLPEDMTELQFTQWVAFVRGFNQSLPCHICRDHMNEFLKKNPLVDPKRRAHYRKGINNWLFTTMFHNEVNQRLEKAIFPEEKIEQMRQMLVVQPGMNSGTLVCPI